MKILIRISVSSLPLKIVRGWLNKYGNVKLFVHSPFKLIQRSWISQFFHLELVLLHVRFPKSNLLFGKFCLAQQNSIRAMNLDCRNKPNNKQVFNKQKTNSINKQASDVNVLKKNAHLTLLTSVHIRTYIYEKCGWRAKTFIRNGIGIWMSMVCCVDCRMEATVVSTNNNNNIN